MPRIRANRKEYQREYKRARPDIGKAWRAENPKEPIVIGIDGEGLTGEDSHHRYTYLAACSVDECISEASNPRGLSSEQCFEFFLAIKSAHPECLLIGFSLGYDFTKILEWLPTRTIYELARPESRRGKKHPLPRRWKRYSINYLRGRLTIARLLPGVHGKGCSNAECLGCKRGDSVNIWDVWGFFQGSFIDACKNWGVVSQVEYDYLKGMKNRRSTFTPAQWEEVKEYCLIECKKLASLGAALRQAHIDANIPLKSYYGAGSTASSMLSKMGVKEYMPDYEALPAELRHACACAFFGGRFEIDRYGPVTQEVYSYDIASAYPYTLTQLPCLACGSWRLVRGRGLGQAIEASNAALVRYTLPCTAAIRIDREACTSEHSWGPFPLRTAGIDRIDDGNIIYPVTSGGGWVYRNEYLAGLRSWPNVSAKEAWVYSTECEHRPFSELANYYSLRLSWGKEGRGIVVKLGYNSVYGKLAQSVGDKPPFQCFLWAGMTTSGTRAQLLELITQGSVIMSATDGIVSLNPLRLPTPVDTGTIEAAKRAGKVELGAWESKTIPDGIMLIRPGIAFPLKKSSDEKETKARGIGKAVLKSHRDMVLESWEKNGARSLALDSDIFHGFKSSTRVNARGYQRSPHFGRWSRRTQSVSYMPEPKRPFALKDDGTLCTWAFGPKVQSAPYERISGGDTPAHVLAMALEKQIQAEQPDRGDGEDEF